MEKGGDITIEDLQEQHRGYAEIVGIDKLIKLSEVYGGTQIYIPKKDELLKNKKYRALYGLRCLMQRRPYDFAVLFCGGVFRFVLFFFKEPAEVRKGHRTSK